MKAYWSFDEGKGSIAYDNSGNGNDGIIYGATWTSGISGYALDFDGLNDHIDCASPILNTAPYSVCAWVKPVSITDGKQHYIVSNGGQTHSSYGFYLLLRYYDENWVFGVADQGGSVRIDASTPASSTDWTFLCGTWDGSIDNSSVKWYINGNLESMGIPQMWWTGPAQNLRIGGPSNAIAYIFHGTIDELRIYNRVLSESEVRYLYHNPGGKVQPPTADFEIHRTDNPGTIKFSATGSNLTGAVIRWDFDGDGVFDGTGGTVMWKYSVSGIKHVTLCVENSAGKDKCTKKFAVLTDYTIECSNDGFFLSYPTTPWTPPLKNKYSFICPGGILDHVTFRLNEYYQTDLTPAVADGMDIWESVLHMNEGSPGDKVKILGYDSENDLVWEEEVDTFILITPPWFDMFLMASDISVYNSNSQDYWRISLVPPNIGLGYRIENVPVAHIGGRYGVNASVSGPQNFTIESSQKLTVYYPLCSLDIPLYSKENESQKPVDLGNYRKAKWNIGIRFAASADVQIDQDEVGLAGCLTLKGEAGVSFDVPVAGIPFLAEAGLTGGVDGEFDTRFVISRFGDDGFTFCPEGFSEVFFGINGHAGMYASMLWGLGRLEGGLFADGKLKMKLPSLHKHMYLYGGVYAKACCWVGCMEHNTGLEFESLDTRYEVFRKNDIRSRFNRNMDLLCLKQYDRKCLFRDSFVSVLSDNVVGNANPQIVLVDEGDALAIWTDVESIGENRFQSDIHWAKYTNGSGWSVLHSFGKNGSCEFDPSIVRVENENGSQSIVITYLLIDDVVTYDSSIETFYENITIGTAMWSHDLGLSAFAGNNISVSNATVNTLDLCYDGNGSVYLTYLVDSDSHPWENGNGSIYLVKGVVNNSTVIWRNPVLIRNLSTFNLSCQPSISFPCTDVGVVAFSSWNETTGNYELVLLATNDSEVFKTRIIRETTGSIEQVSCDVLDRNVTVSWVENRCAIYACKILINESIAPDFWNITAPLKVYSGLEVSFIKPVFSDDRCFYLFQAGERYTPFVIERLSNGSWGNIRPISLEGSYSLGHLDGDSNEFTSQMIYTRDVPVENWQVGHWRFSEGEGNVTLDGSDFGNDGIISGFSYTNSSVYWVKNNGELGNLSEDYGYCLRFVNGSGFVVVPYNHSLDLTDEFSLCSWIKLCNYTDGTSLISKEGSWVLFEDQGSLGLKLWRENGSVVLSDIATIPLETWTFVATLYDHGVVNVSILPNGFDNVSVEYALGNVDLNVSNAPLVIGGFNGSVEEVRLFNRAITGSVIDSIWFSPYATLGGLHDIVVQHMPSFAGFNFSTTRKGIRNITTEDVVEFTGYPSGFDFSWDFGDGSSAVGETVYHKYETPGFYKVVCDATDPFTGVVTPSSQTIYIHDATKPIFHGLKSALAGDGYVTLRWNPAEDTSPFLLYHVYMHKENESFNFSNPTKITSDTNCTINGLDAGVTYYFIVRAMDAAGNRETNMAVLSATPFDTSPPVFKGLKTANNISNVPGSIFLEWNEAKDATQPILYNIYMANSSGVQNFSNPLISTNRSWHHITNLDDQMYYFVVRAEDTWGNEDDNIVELKVRPFIDMQAPEISEVHTIPWVQGSDGLVNISCKVSDNSRIDAVVLNITHLSSSYDYQMMNHIPLTDKYYINTSYPSPGIYHYFIWTSDIHGNCNTSSTYTFIVQDRTPPEIISIFEHPDPQIFNGYVNISCEILENGVVDVVKVNLTYPDGETINVTMTPGKRRYFYNATYSLPGTYYYFIWANDTENNSNISCIYQFKILEDTLPPVTMKSIGPPKYGLGDKWVTSNSEFHLIATDDLSGVNKTYYRIWHNGTWNPAHGVGINNEFMEYRVSFYLSGEGKHYLEYYSTDKACNVEDIQNQTHYIDDSSPETILEFGLPNYIEDDNVAVTSDTTIYLNATDYPTYASQVKEIWYDYGDGWKVVPGNKATFTIPDECIHTVQWYALDNLGNAETINSKEINIDNTPPVTSEETGEPKYWDENIEWLNKSSPIWLNATDQPASCSTGIDYIHYEIWWDNDNDGTVETKLKEEKVYNETATFNLEEECLHEIRWYAVDLIGHMEETHYQQYKVENTPPNSWKIVGDPKWPETGSNEGKWVTTNTAITLEATDTGKCPVDVWRIHWEIYNESGLISSGISDWNTNATIYFKEECNHTLIWWAEDKLGNLEEKQIQHHYVDDTSPITNIVVRPIHLDTPIQPFPPIVTAFMVILTADDTGECAVGEDHIVYRIKNKFGLWSKWQEEEPPIHLKLPGNILGIEYYSVDLLGNMEEIHYKEFTSTPTLP